MRNDTALRIEAMNFLIQKLGELDAERFICIVKSDNFDYTEWRKNLWSEKTLEEIHAMGKV